MQELIPELPNVRAPAFHAGNEALTRKHHGEPGQARDGSLREPASPGAPISPGEPESTPTNAVSYMTPTEHGLSLAEGARPEISQIRRIVVKKDG